jgi:hypothetical protein
MQTFRHHSARAKCGRIGVNGEMAAVYSGPVSAATFRTLSPLVLAATRGASVIVIRMDGCLTLMESPPHVPQGAYAVAAPDGCVIVRADQIDLWSGYAERMAQHGIRRVIFLDSQLPLALQWLARRSLLRALPELLR